MVTASHQNPTFMLIIKLGLQVATHITLMIRLWLQVTNHCDCSSTTVTAVVRLWPQDIKPQLLRARLHFPYSAQNMNQELAQIIKFLLSPSDSCQWPSGRHPIPPSRPSAGRWFASSAVFRDLDYPPFCGCATSVKLTLTSTIQHFQKLALFPR